MRVARTVPLILLVGSILYLSVWGAGVFPGSLCIVVLLLCGGAVLTVLQSRTELQSGGIKVTWPAWAWVLLLVAVAATAVPCPGRMDIVFGPRRYEQDNRVRESVSRATELGLIEDVQQSFSLTRNRAGTVRMVLLLTIVLCAGVIGSSLSNGQRRFLVMFLVCLLAIMSIAGFLHQWIIPRQKTLWWIWTVPHGRPVGCFVNRTHHAGFIAIVAPLALSVLGYSFRDGKILAGLFSGAAYVLMSFGVLVSMSRGAVLTLFVGSATVLLFLAAHGPTRRIGIRLGAAVFVVACSCFAVGQLPTGELKEEVQERLETLKAPAGTDSAQRRFSVWRDSMRIWRDYAILGVGGNAFRMVFPQYRTSKDREFFTHTENEYVSMLVEGGVAGALLALLVGAALLTTWRINVQHGVTADIIAAGATGSLTGALVHNALDFPFRAPLYAMVIAVTVGMVLSRGESVSYPLAFDIPRVAAVSVLAAPALFLTIHLMLAGGADVLIYDSHVSIAHTDLSTLGRMLVRSPTSWQTWYFFGEHAMRAGNLDANRLAARCVTTATEYDPNNYLMWEGVGYIRYELGDEAGARSAFARMNELRDWKRAPEMRMHEY